MRNEIIKFAVLIVLIAVALLIAFSYDASLIDPDTIEGFIKGLGVWAPVGFVLLASIAAATFFPGTVFTVAGGILFGPLMGTVYSVIAAVIGATIGFWVSRFLGEPFVSRFIKDRSGRIKRYKDKIEKESLAIVFILRLVPLVPFVILTVAAGLSSVKYSRFILATFLGIIPGTFVYAYAGQAFASLDPLGIAISAALLLSLVVIGLLYRAYHPEIVAKKDKIFNSSEE